MTAAAAEALRSAAQARRKLAPLDPAIAPATEAAGYAVQVALAAQGDATPPAGFKVGATAKAMQDYLGVHGPAAGFMAQAGLHGSGFATPYADWLAPGVECEIALRLGHDIAFTGTAPSRETAAAAVAAAMPAIEIVENRYADIAAMGVPTLIADRFFHAGAVLGPETPIAADDIVKGALAMAIGGMMVNGAVFGKGSGADLMGDPLNVLCWLAGSEAARAFGGLRAGQVVMCGSVTPPAWLDGPAEVVVSFVALGTVQLRFT